jgi:protein TonB
MKVVLATFVLLLFLGETHAQNTGNLAATKERTKDTVVVDQDSVYSGDLNVNSQFKGGDKAFQEYVFKNFVYPPRCMDNAISGSVLLQFVVDVDGSIVNIKVLEVSPKCPEFAQEAIRILRSSPKWIPAMHNGIKVKTYHQLPIKMSIE